MEVMIKASAHKRKIGDQSEVEYARFVYRSERGLRGLSVLMRRLPRELQEQIRAGVRR